jgi:hypothetical protein
MPVFYVLRPLMIKTMCREEEIRDLQQEIAEEN